MVVGWHFQLASWCRSQCEFANMCKALIAASALQTSPSHDWCRQLFFENWGDVANRLTPHRAAQLLHFESINVQQFHLNDIIYIPLIILSKNIVMPMRHSFDRHARQRAMCSSRALKLAHAFHTTKHVQHNPHVHHFFSVVVTGNVLYLLRLYRRQWSGPCFLYARLLTIYCHDCTPCSCSGISIQRLRQERTWCTSAFLGIFLKGGSSFLVSSSFFLPFLQSNYKSLRRT